MAITRVQATPVANVTNAASVSVTFTVLPIVGNGIAVGVVTSGGDTWVTGCSDNKGNTYVLSKQQGPSIGTGCVAIFHCNKITTTGAPFTITVTSSPTTDLTMRAIEVNSELTVNVTSSGGVLATTAFTPPTSTLAIDTGFAVAAISIWSVETSITAVASLPASPAWNEEAEKLSGVVAGEIDSRVLTGVLGTSIEARWTYSTNAWSAYAIAFFSGVINASVGPIPINYWPLNEATGATTADIVGDKNSTVDESLSDWIPGKFGSSLSMLSRVSGAVGLFSPINLGTTHSIALWLKATTGGIALGGNATGHYGLFINAPDILYSAGTGNFVSVPYTPDSNWHHYVITRSSGSVKFYVDGIQKGTTQTLGTPANSITLNSFGSYGFNPFDFPTQGQLDEVRFYSTELTAGQVTTLYNLNPDVAPVTPVTPYITIIDYDRAFTMVANQTYAMPSRIVSGNIFGLVGSTDLQTSIDGTTWTTFTTLGAGTQAAIRFIPQTPFIRATQNAIISLNRRKGLGRQILNANNG